MIEKRERRQSLDEMLVIDADVHLHEKPAEMAAYIDEPWKQSLEIIGSFQDERYLALPGFAPGDSFYFPIYRGGGDGGRAVWDVPQMRDELDKINVDIGILFPDHLLKLAVHPRADYAAALARAYNAWMVDRWCTREKGLLGCIIACNQDPLDAAREIEKYAKEPTVVGVYLPTAGVNPLWGSRKYDPIFQAAQDADLPVLLHSVTVVHPVFPAQLHEFQTELGQHTVSHMFAMMANMTSMIETGVCERFPDLRVAFTEAGVSWVPAMAHRLDKEYMELRRYVPILKKRPSHYLKQWYFATQPLAEPENPQDIVDMVRLYDGFSTTMFASDWPHHDFDHPRYVYKLPWPSEAIRRKVMGENALEFFRMDRDGYRLNLK